MKEQGRPGATYLGDGRCQFVVWAPFVDKIEVHITAPDERLIALKKGGRGYYHTIAENVAPGSLYFYRLDGKIERPDPASRFQPQGVHGSSQVVDSNFSWRDEGWTGIPLEDYIIYEVHTGTFTAEGTFTAIIPHLDTLKELGITALELMPVAQFPGKRNWGYDGVYPFAVQESYGGPKGLKQLVDACHHKGMAVILDVIYNHLGPEGNYLADFGPYFTERYQTPWGRALNFDGPDSDEVRRFFIENALYWIREFHIDALRMDALHAILDMSPCTFIEELARSVRDEAENLKRKVYLIGESAANDVRLIRDVPAGGYGLDAQWNDDFHHAVHVLLTGEKTGYYQDYGEFRQLVKAFEEGFVYSGQYSAYRRRRHGTSSEDIPAWRFVVFTQNHDQVGNRAQGERLSGLVSFEQLKLAAALYLLSPFVPLVFMGEEYGETAPFPYFISHSEPALIEAVRKGRREEFSTFRWQGDIPDPQDEATFKRARLNHHLRNESEHRTLFAFYQELIRLRKQIAALRSLNKKAMKVIGYEKERVLFLHRWKDESEAIIIYNCGEDESVVSLPVPVGRWQKRLDSAEAAWGGDGSSTPETLQSQGEPGFQVMPASAVLFVKEK
ncbi:MAG: malto-oligosyltrehalose trehalohydrolase [Chloroflexota bacterium]